jgi:putative Holliday junction resolvase
MGLDVGDKTVGIAISDRRIKIASIHSLLLRSGTNLDYEYLLKHIKQLKIGAIIFGWPLQMNGLPGEQCKKILQFIVDLSEQLEANSIQIDFAKWDERFSTKVVDNIMLEANLSRKRRKQVIDKTAATYILQGAIDFLNRTTA